MKIGIDLDNTIIDYQGVFSEIAIEKGYIKKQDAHTKEEVKQLMHSKGMNEEFTELQGLVYGKEILRAKPMQGVIEAMKKSRSMKVDLVIISHKTRYPYKGEKIDLHIAAKDWLTKNNLLREELTGITEDKLFFEATMEDKINRIKREKCDAFIDDLETVLEKLPRYVSKIHFNPSTGKHGSQLTNKLTLQDFNELEGLLKEI